MTDIAAIEQRLPTHLVQWAPQFSMAETCFGLDPYLMAAICERESKGQWNVVGDSGHGRGLFQIDDRSHSGFTGARFDDSSPLWANPTLNAAYAARLFSHNLRGAGGDLIVAVGAYNCGLSRAIHVASTAATPLDKIKALDQVTTNNYVSGVLSLYATFCGQTNYLGA